MDSSSSCFHSDPDFCPECGSILPLPGLQDSVTCPRCKFKIDVKDFEGKVVQSSTVFNKLEGSTMLHQGEERVEIQGPLIERKCPRCSHEGMTYHTRQMRSADEGQTVFYMCMKCKYQEKEDS
ncbi:DNA-directed RNA polymerase I subunit RPA12 [Microcaecilia unicolor]|uniref:DNA-directed RNA polymerase subunit n=1 Tax=Microcaecilia unicolor TaxID=1415580 RepID=A0A6P7XKQ0_9AMPH|nr:DNA-directed RNA polymerase I subunit RPA12 [Microcaecilia unicolor]XP_030051230.1 DNA-directed RNA polymerase I subunit RPA12 [Microcaecilia unicolor]